MRFAWDEQTNRWFLDASIYTGFHKILAQKIVPFIEPGDSLLDAGCGLGRLDLELAAFVSSLTAVDLSENAIAALQRDAEALGLKNLSASVRDASSLSEQFDIALLSFFGQSNMLDFLKLCRKRLVRIAGADNRSGLYPERYRCTVKDTVPTIIEELDKNSVPYKLELHTIEFGQPLKSRQDAEQYILKNAPEATAHEIGEFLEKSITYTGREEFPLYLPNPKELGIFIIDVIDTDIDTDKEI